MFHLLSKRLLHKLFRILLHHYLFIHTFICLYQCRLIHIYFILWVLIQYYLTLLLKLLQLWPYGNSSCQLLYLSDISASMEGFLFLSFFFLKHFLSGTSFTLCISLPSPPTATLVLDSAISVRSPHSFYWRMVLGPKICVLYICFLLFGCNICVYTYQCIGTSVNVSTGNHLYLCYTQHEFVLMLLTLIHYQVDHSSLFPLLFCELSFKQ